MQSSASIADPEGHAWRTAPVSVLLKFWWALWTVSSWGGNVLARNAFSEPADLAALRTEVWAFIVTAAIELPAAILAILIV